VLPLREPKPVGKADSRINDMVNTLPTPQNLITDTWVVATWEAFSVLSESLESEQVRCYYDAPWMRIETMPIGFAHGRDNALLASVVSLYGTLKNLPFLSITNGSFRAVGERECQPDLAFYLGAALPNIPRSNSPVDVNLYEPPTLAIEVSSTTLSDDLGQKRLLYERLGVAEYWVVSVEAVTVIAFEIAGGGSRQIQISAVLPDLPISVIEEALRRSQAEEDGAVNRWLLRQFS
jgi:Uma2 family endonuclease